MPLDGLVVRRFHKVLVDEIRKSTPDYLEGSFTVAEIYQSLVPYRTHRDRIGVDLNGDYEAALLRLLGGEGEYLAMESETARGRIQRELKSSNPNTGLYREFAAVQVRLNPDTLPSPDLELDESDGKSAKGGDTGKASGGKGKGDGKDEENDWAGDARSARKAESGKPSPKAHGEKDDSDPPAAVDIHLTGRSIPRSESGGESDGSVAEEAAGKGSPSGGKADHTQVSLLSSGSSSSSGSTPAPPRPKGGRGKGPPTECPDCRSDLPDREKLRFCPFCGTNVFIMPCGDCGEVLERSWSFCIACGTSTND